MSGFDLNDQSFIKEYTIVEKQIIFAFPSRESIEYGFDRSFYDHFSEMRETFNSASDILKINITDHIFSGNTLPDNLKMPILLAHCYGSVSYTHLDVYKRQPLKKDMIHPQTALLI